MIRRGAYAGSPPRRAGRKPWLSAIGSVAAALSLLPPIGSCTRKDTQDRVQAAATRTATVPDERHSVRPGINQEYQDGDVEKWVARFERPGRELFRDRHEIVDALGLEPGMAVADVGAGTGLFTMLLAQRVGPTGAVYAVDIIPAFLDYIGQRAQDDDLTNVRTVLCKEDSVELPEASVDVVFVCDTYHHFEYPARTMRSIHRALRPDGRLVVIDFKRIEGVSRQWVLDHVRAGQEQTAREIIAVGFALDPSGPKPPPLDENYFLRFRKVAAAAP